MATELAKAYIQIIPSMKGVSENINKELSGIESKSNGKPIGEKIGNVIGTGIGLGIKGAGALAVASVGAITTGIAGATKGIAELAKQSVSSYADFEQLQGGIETLFGADNMDKMMSAANTAFERVGLSANEYMETVTGFSASLIQSLGGDTAKASEVADMALVDMADNANKMGSSMESIQNAYAGFSKQNYTMLDNLKLGYGGTKTEMERLLKDAEKISGIKYNIDSFADVTQAIHVMQESMGIAGTTAKEATSTISGSINMMKKSWENVLTSFASGNMENVKGFLDDFIKSVKTTIENIVPLIKDMLPTIVNALSYLVSALIPVVVPIITDLLPVIVNAIAQLLQEVIKQLPTLLSALNSMIPMIVDIIIDNLPAIMGAGLQIIVTLASAILENLPKLLESIPKIFRAMVDAFKTVDWKTIGRNIIDGIKNGLASAWSGIISWLKSKCGEMISTVKSFFGIHSPSTVFRDQIGINLAKGLGIGFVDEMDDVNKQMQDAVETEFNVNGSANISADVAKNAYRGSNLSNTDSILTTIVNKLDNLANMQIVLDSGTLVGSTAPQMNVALGRISTREAYR